MTSSRRTTWIVGTLTLAVLVGVVVASWRPVMERWHAARLADEELSHENRLHAARRLRDFGSPLLMEIAVELMSKYPAIPRTAQVEATWAVLQDAHWQNEEKDFSETYAAVSAVVLKRTLEDGEEREKRVARSLLILLGEFGLQATPDLLDGMQSDDQAIQAESFGVLLHMLLSWTRGEGWGNPPPTSEKFARRLGIDHYELCKALVVVTKSKSFQTRIYCEVFFGQDLSPSEELRDMRLRNAHEPPENVR